MKIPALSFTLAAGTFLAGCLLEGGDVPGTRATARFEFRAVGGDSALAKRVETGLKIFDLSGLEFAITEARAHVGRIKLESGDDDSCEASPLAFRDDDDSGSGGDRGGSDSADGDDDDNCGEREISLRGSFVVDLLAGTSQPGIGSLNAPAGEYDELRIRLEPARGGLAPGDPLLGHTLHVRGTMTLPGGMPKPFELNLRFDEELRLEDEDGLVLDPGSVKAFLVSLDAGRWLDGVDFGSCLGRPEVEAELTAGTIRISEDSKLGSCLQVENILKENIRHSFDVDDDRDGPGGDDDGKDSI